MMYLKVCVLLGMKVNCMQYLSIAEIRTLLWIVPVKQCLLSK